MKQIYKTLLLALAIGLVCKITLVAAEPKPSKKNDPIAAKKLFGFVLNGANLKAKAIGFYARGCLAGGKMLSVDGPSWQAMRLSRNRNWGHPKLIKFLERFANTVKEKGEWPGLLVGDLSQPRGGPMLSGHRSHQIGLDADIWLNPMPDKRLTVQQREEISAVSMLDNTKLKVNPKVWTDGHVALVKRASSFKEVQRILVHPAIKKALCDAAGNDRGWLRKVRPWWGHHYHMHIRLRCDGPACKGQGAPPAGDGCGKPLENWFKILKRPVKPIKKKPKKTARVRDMSWMPKACRTVLAHEKPPLYKAFNLPKNIDLPVRKPEGEPPI